MADANGRRVAPTITSAALAEAELTSHSSVNANWLDVNESPTAYLDGGNDLQVRAIRQGLIKAGDVLPGDTIQQALLRMGVIGS